MKLSIKERILIKRCLEDCANSDDYKHLKHEIYQLVDLFENRQIFVAMAKLQT